MAGPVRPRLTPAEGRRFAFTLAGAFFALAMVMWWRHRVGISVAAGSLAALLLVAGGLVPGKLGPVHHAWMALAHLISRVTTPIFMAAVYFGVITPISLVMRLVGHNPLKRPATEGSFWVVRTVPEQRTDIERQF